MSQQLLFWWDLLGKTFDFQRGSVVTWSWIWVCKFWNLFSQRSQLQPWRFDHTSCRWLKSNLWHLASRWQFHPNFLLKKWIEKVNSSPSLQRSSYVIDTTVAILSFFFFLYWIPKITVSSQMLLPQGNKPAMLLPVLAMCHILHAACTNLVKQTCVVGYPDLGNVTLV